MIGNYSRCLIAEAKPAKLWLLTDGYMILPFQQQASAGPRESPGLKIWSRPPYWSGGWRMLNVCVRVKSLFRSIQIQTTSAWTSSYEVRFTCNCSLLPNCICCPSTTSIYIYIYIYIMSTLLKFHSFLLKSPLSLVKHNEIPILDWCFTGIFGYFGLRHASHTMGIPWILRS